MLAYNKTYSEFCDDINSGQIVLRITDALGRDFSLSEKKAFKISLSSVKNALANVTIPSEAQVGVELNVPLTNKRIDFIIAGEDDDDRKNVVIVELKQWDKVKHTDMSDIVLLGHEEKVHPSWQAFSYGTTISNFNEYVEDNPVNIYSCSFLHDYDTKYVDEIKNEIYADGLKKSPAFIGDEWKRFAEFVSSKITKGSDVNLLYEISNGRIKPSKFLVDCLSDSLTGNNKIELLDKQRITFSNLKKEIDYKIKMENRQIDKLKSNDDKNIRAIKGYSDFYNELTIFLNESRDDFGIEEAEIPEYFKSNINEVYQNYANIKLDALDEISNQEHYIQSLKQGIKKAKRSLKFYESQDRESDFYEICHPLIEVYNMEIELFNKNEESSLKMINELEKISKKLDKWEL